MELAEGYRRSLRLNIFSLFSSGSHLVNRSGTILAIFVDFSFSSMGGHLVYPSGLFLAILVGSHLGNVPIKFE